MDDIDYRIKQLEIDKFEIIMADFLSKKDKIILDKISNELSKLKKERRLKNDIS